MEDNVVRVIVGAVEGEGSVMQSHSVFNIEREENNALRALLNNVLNCCLGRDGKTLSAVSKGWVQGSALTNY